MLNLRYPGYAYSHNQEEIAWQFDECSASIQQIIECIEAAEAQLREKRQALEAIKARHEALVSDMALAVSELDNVLIVDGIRWDNTPTPSVGLQGVSDLVKVSQSSTEGDIDPASFKAGVIRVLERKKRPHKIAKCSESGAGAVPESSS